MARRLVMRTLCVFAVSMLGFGASVAYGDPPVELSAEISSFECSESGLTVTATASVPSGSGANLRSAYLSAGQFRVVEDSWSPFPNTRVAEWWSTDEWWGRKDATTSSTLSVETGPSGSWESHSWSGDADTVAGTATEIWQIWFSASGSHRGTYLSDSALLFVDCTDGIGTVVEAGPATGYCVETATQPAECYQ